MRILIISVFFAPIGGVATERIRKFTKYLPDFGWEPIVLTRTLDTYRRLKSNEIDESILDELPKNLKIFRAPSLVLNTTQHLNVEQSSAVNQLLATCAFLARRIFLMFLLPDKHILWTRSAVKEGRKIIHDDNIDVILATGPSFSSFIVGAILRRLTKRPLILDYRDPGALNSIFFPNSPIRRIINRKIEKWCLYNMDAGLFATEGFRQLYTDKYPDLSNRCHVISNGYDGNIEQYQAREISESAPIKIAYAGKIHGDQYPVADFFKAVSRYTLSHGKSSINVQMAGEISIENKKVLNDNNLSDVITLRGYLHKSEVDAMLLESDILLLIIGDGHKFLYGLESAKLYDYLRYSRPILALVPEEGAVWKFINSNDLGKLSPPSNADRILSVLEDLNQDLRNSKNKSKTNENIDQFHRRELSSQLAGLCLSIVSPPLTYE